MGEYFWFANNAKHAAKKLPDVPAVLEALDTNKREFEEAGGKHLGTAYLDKQHGGPLGQRQGQRVSIRVCFGRE